MRIGYFFRVCSGATFSKLSGAINTVHTKSGKNKAGIFFDMVGCFLKYRAGYNDYVLFEYYNMTADQRKTYMTRFKNKRFMLMQNDLTSAEIFNDKRLFDTRFAKYLGRRVLVIEEKITLEQFSEFIKPWDVFIAKPAFGECGKGIEKLVKADFKSDEEFYNYVFDKENEFGVLEEAIKQHPDVSKIYPHSINCLRIATLVVDGKPNILYAVFKTGNNGKFVDNLENGGFACHFDLDTGTVTGPGHTSDMEIAYEHPYSGIKFKGFKIPYCEEVKELVKNASLEEPEFKYCGWDVCISENGPAIIEGNDYAAYDFPQLPDEDTPKVGLISIIKQYIPDLKL